MNILLLTSDFLPNIGGMASHALELARAHVQNGHRLELVHPVHGAGDDHVEEVEGFTVHKLFVDNQTPKIKHVLYIRKVRDYVRRLP